MLANQVFQNVSGLADVLRELRVARRQCVKEGRKESVRARALTMEERSVVFGKTDGRCHICGGPINDRVWQADHVLPRSAGGKHAVDNFLPAHSICNNYRWHYSAEEFQWIIKIGVWMRTQIEKGTPIGRDAGQKFCDYDRRRADRRKLA